MIQGFGKRMEAKTKKIQEMFTKELEDLKNNNKKLNNTISEMTNTLEGIDSRINEAEEWISELEDKLVEITVAEQNKEKRMKRNEDSLRQGSPTPRLWTGTGLQPVRNQAAQQEVSGGQVSKASYAAPHCSHYHLNHHSHYHLNQPPTPNPVHGKIVFHETSPWCQKGWGLLV